MITLKNRRVWNFLSVYLLFSLPMPLFGQEESGIEQEFPVEQERDPEYIAEEYDSAADTLQIIFYIRDIKFYNIKGKSRHFALMYRGEFKAGERIEGEAGLKRYLRNKTQLLLNQRALEKVEIEYTLGEAEEDGLVPVDLLVKVADTWNILVLPYPKFDSNSGIEVTIKARDYNFLGTLSPLRIDLGYQHKESLSEPSKDVFKFEIDSDTPFRAFGLNWNLDFDHIFSLTLQDTDPVLSYKNITGLSVEVPYSRTTFTFGFEEVSVLKEENPSQYKKEYGDYADFYMSSKLYGSWKIPLGIKVYNFGELAYTPDISGRFNYRPDGGLEFWRKGPTLTFGQRLGFGRVDWVGNYRSGLEGAVKNSNTYDFYEKGWDFNYSISAVSHRVFSDFFGISSQFQFKHWFFKDSDGYTEVGDALRGITDKSLVAKNNNCMLSLNLDFPLRVLHFMPSEWLETRKLRLFNFDLHFSPFIDIALLWGLNQVEWENGVIEYPTDPSLDVSATVGFEFIVFPAFTRSIYLRASFGYNLRNWWDKGHPNKLYGDEYFIGIGHHY